MMYVDPETSFQKQHFQMFCDVVEDHFYTISQEWITDLNTCCEILAFRICGHTYLAHSLCLASCKKLFVSMADFEGVIASIKDRCQDACKVLIAELDKRFPDFELMNALVAKQL
jgi:hypothetical protein